jgi:tetratricopeptide (TPR) repeat protein
MPTVKVVANPSKGDGMPESVKETVRTHLDHGRACLDKGKYDDAIADYDKVIALDPNVALAYINRGVAYGRKGAFDRAIADYTKAIALDRKYTLAYTNRGVAYAKKGDKEQAIADFRKALEIRPSDQDAKNNLKRLGVTP